MKTAAIVTTFLICVFAGMFQAISLKKRVRQLQTVYQIIHDFGMEMSYLKRSPQDFFSSERTLPLFAFMAQQDGNLEQRYFKVKKECADRMFLKPADWEILDAFWNTVGKSGADNQKTICQYTQQRLTDQISEAQKNCDKYFKLYYMTGLMAGLFLVVILI